MKRFWENFLSVFKYLLAIFMMISGVLTGISPVTSIDGPLAFIYSSRFFLVSCGILFFYSGASLFYGKIKRDREWTGRGLLFVYLSFVFATVLNAVSYHFDPTAWVGNLICSLIVGALYLRWRLKTNYIDPRHFIDDVKELS